MATTNTLPDSLRALAKKEPLKFYFDHCCEGCDNFWMNGNPVYRINAQNLTQDDADAILAELGMQWECTMQTVVGEEGHSDGSTESYWMDHWRWEVHLKSRITVEGRSDYGAAYPYGTCAVSGKSDSKHSCAIAATIAAINFYLEAK